MWQSGERGTRPKTTAELRAERMQEWARWFTGEASVTAYRTALAKHTSLTWEALWDAQSDLLRLLVDRVPAELGAPALLAITTLSARHAKPDEAGRALLATLVNELAPGHAYTVFAALADAWANAATAPYAEREQRIRAVLCRVFRQLAAAGADREGALQTLAVQLALDEDDHRIQERIH